MANDPVREKGVGCNTPLGGVSESIHQHFLADENEVVATLLIKAAMSEAKVRGAQELAASLIEGSRERLSSASGLHALLSYYDLSSHEGIVLMCLAEALLRIPDDETVDALIADKLSSGQWQQHVGKSESFFVNASTWALLLTGRMLRPKELTDLSPESFIAGLAGRMEGVALRAAVRHAMRLIAEQYVLGDTIDKALLRAEQQKSPYSRYSFDMLGEAALTEQDASRYLGAYREAILAIGQSADRSQPLMQRHGISIKLSALYPRYEFSQRSRAKKILVRRLLELAHIAREAGISVTVDAEESDRLVLSLDIFSEVYSDESLSGWEGLGLAVQAYQKRALPVLEYINELATLIGKRIPVRLVKGAYWDTEIKRAQQMGLRDYPVFTQKQNTDISYLACAKYLLENTERLYPQFASHNAYTLACILQLAKTESYELQRLQGMGEEVYAELLETQGISVPCRVYAPVGAHQDLLPYLVRRLLENGANTSFVNQLAHPDEPIDQLVSDPVKQAQSEDADYRHPDIPLPVYLFGAERLNSRGVNFHDEFEVRELYEQISPYFDHHFQAQPLIDGAPVAGASHDVSSPANVDDRVGRVTLLTDKAELSRAVDVAYNGWSHWKDKKVEQRAQCLLRAADLFEQHQAELIALCVREAGKTVRDSQAEIREAVDFLRYYACSAESLFAEPQVLSGVTGEANSLYWKGRGVFVCISPWNFPAAIFCGQVAAALVAGNSVLAKPASVTCLIAGRIVELLHEAGIPKNVLQFIPCSAKLLSQTVLSDRRIAGVAFTGSTQAAQEINRTLAARDAPIAVLIAETGGQNALLADSSTLPEQLVKDVVQSAFNSAGQRCSALRVLYVQNDIASRVTELLKGAMDELHIGAPRLLQTDVGPVISLEAADALRKHISYWKQRGALIHQPGLPDAFVNGNFVAPALIEIESISQLEEEHFGPVLHLVQYEADQLEAVLDEINATNYALTFGIHSRLEQRVEAISEKVSAGNLYVNRDMVGAVVGVQPFGGCRLSGTGPKAGGPHYLLGFATEQTLAVNTAAAGGNALLLGQLK